MKKKKMSFWNSLAFSMIQWRKNGRKKEEKDRTKLIGKVYGKG